MTPIMPTVVKKNKSSGSVSTHSSTKLSTNEKSVPWYKEFWAWFILMPLIIVVIASLSMVILAFRIGQDTVSDDYYKVGKLINHAFEARQAAKDRQLAANVRFDLDRNEVFISLSINESSEYQVTEENHVVLLTLSHPFEAERDRQVILRDRGAGMWHGSLNNSLNNSLNTSLTGRWYIRVSENDGAGHEAWRIGGEVTLPSNGGVILR